LIAVCHRKTFPLLPSQMTHEAIGDPPAPPTPSGPRHGHTSGAQSDVAANVAYPQAAGQQACSFAASGQNLPSPQTASQEEDRKMTGSFTLPTRPEPTITTA